MIDWLTFVAPLSHRQGIGGPFWAGEVISTVPDPEQGEAIAWAVQKRREVVGSYSAKVQVQSTHDEGARAAIWVSGNPAKWFQGHNIFGSDDLPGLVREMLHRVCLMVGVTPSAEDLQLWELGVIKLTRVDVTSSFGFGTLPRVRNAIRSLDSTARLKHRGRGHFKGDSLTFGKGSRRSSLTLYAKGSEIEVHKLPSDLAETSLTSHAQGLLRAEVRLLSMQLKEEHLDYVAYWGENSAQELHDRFMSGLEIAEATMLDAPTLDGLPGRLQLAYDAWKAGNDLRATLSRPTFYRYRAQLLAHGIDIAVRQERTVSNVVQLQPVLRGHAVGVPEWAVGTPLYFEPRAKVA